MRRRHTVTVVDTRTAPPPVVTHFADIPGCPWPLPTESEADALGLVAIHGGSTRNVDDPFIPPREETAA